MISARFPIIALIFLIAAYSKPAVSQPSPSTPMQPDPVAELKRVIDSIPKDQRKPPEDKLRKVFAGKEKFLGSTFEEMANVLYDYSVVSYDVEKTTSLVTPFIGYIFIDEYVQNPGGVRSYGFSYKATFSFQDGQWVLKNVEGRNNNVAKKEWNPLVGKLYPDYLALRLSIMFPGQPVPSVVPPK